LLNGVFNNESWINDFCTKQTWGNFFTCHAATFAAQPKNFIILKCLAMGIFVLACAFSSLVAAPIISDQLGRVISLFVGNLFALGGTLAVIFSNGQGVFLLGRALDGIGIGLIAATVPVYIAEMSPVNQRKWFGLITPIGVGLGLVAGLAFSYAERQGYNWRYIMGVPIIFSGLMLLGCLALPETPMFQDLRELRRRGAAALDAQSVRNVQGGARNVAVEMPDRGHVRANDAEFEPVPLPVTHPTGLVHQSVEECERRLFWTTHLKRIFETPSLRKRILLSALGQWMQAWTGLNAFIFYSVAIYLAAGFFNPLTSSIIALSAAAAGLIFGAALIDVIPRKVLSLLGGIGTTLALAAVAGTYTATVKTASTSLISNYGIVFLVLTAFACFLTTFTWGQLSWTVPSEIFPTPYRSTAIAFSAFNQWLAIASVVFATPWILRGIGVMGLFWVFTGVAAVGTILAGIFVPETLNVPADSIAMDKLFASEKVSASHPEGLSHRGHSLAEPAAARYLEPARGRSSAAAASVIPSQYTAVPTDAERIRSSLAGAGDKVREHAREAGEAVRGAADSAARRARDAATSAKQSVEAAGREARDKARELGDAARHQAEHAAEGIRHGAETARDRARDLGESARRQTEQAVGQARDAASHAAGQVRDTASHVAGQARDAASHAVDQARDVASHAARDVQHGAERMQDEARNVSQAAERGVRNAADAAQQGARDVSDRVKQAAAHVDDDAKRAAERAKRQMSR